MPKNKIIPQMFDVRPVDETGDLDWKKINEVGGYDECVGDDPFSKRIFKSEFEDAAESEKEYDGSGLRAFVLGEPVESNRMPILHEEDFNLASLCVGDESRDISFGEKRISKNAQILEEKKRLEQERHERKMSQIAHQNFLVQQREQLRKDFEAKTFAEQQQILQKKILLEKEKEQQRLLKLAEQENLFKKREQLRKDFEAKKLAEQEQILQKKIRLEQEKEEQRLFKLAEQNRLVEQREKLRRELEARALAASQERELAIKKEKERKDQQKAMILEIEKRRLEKQQAEVLEKIQKLHKEREAQLIAQKTEEKNERQEFIKAQAIEKQEELKRITEYNRQQDEAYRAAVMLEREERDRQHAKWLEQEKEAEEKERKFQEALLKKARKRSKKESTRKRLLDADDDGQQFSWRDIFFPKSFSFQFDANKSLISFAAVILTVSLSVGSLAYASKGFGLKGMVLGASTDGLENLNSAMSDMAHQNFEGSAQKLDKAFADFSESSTQLESMGGVLLDVTRFVPFASKLSSGKNAVEAGKHFSAAGKSLNEIAKIAAEFKNPIGADGQSDFSLLAVFEVAQKNISEAKIELDAAQENLDKIAIDDLPEDKRGKFLLVKQKLPDIRSALDLFLNNSHIFADLLGGNGPRKYLFLFQNNSEMRATGGFIGSYGLLDISNGHIKKFFIDGIFNPDGQLRDKIVPPVPIQKISANWSMHDSNWFADFPTSAKKAIQFYEKTGGPTADGVITITPAIMQKLLEITGPINMPEYGVTLDSKNFVELTQFKVEVDYDKKENKPKKILSDLAPLVLEKLLSSKDLEVISKTAQAFIEGLGEKHILFYSENAELQKIISKQGWSGEIISTPKDYLSVINTNVNGFKTDAVVDESIDHVAEIQADGSIVDTVTITRKHNGGDSKYEWLNKVNADYMRVFVPEGSKLLEVSGQTREVNKAPLDYDALGFKRDEQVQKEENSIVIDEASGTRVYNESGKTVFANWTYVSPGETMRITYKYVLPFSMFKVAVSQKHQADSYSLALQKQSGSVGSKFSSRILYPSSSEVKWNFPETAEKSGGELKNEGVLLTDKFVGAVFEKK